MKLMRRHSEEVVPNLSSISTGWQSHHAARKYDTQRFTGVVGRPFNTFSMSALRRALKAAGNDLDTLLDVACGTGRATEVAARFGREIVGTDIAPAMVQRADLRPDNGTRRAFVVADANHQPFAERGFDCVLAIRFLVHLDGDERRHVLKELARLARRHLILEYAYTSVWLRQLAKLKRLYHRTRGRQFWKAHTLARRAIEDELLSCGFKPSGYFYTARGVSESVILLATRT